MDDHTTVGALRRAVHSFQHARDWDALQSPKSLAMSIAIEAAELMEHFQWLGLQESDDHARNPASRAEVAHELADILIYCLSFANRTGIDLSEAVCAKLAINACRWPVARELPGLDGQALPG